MSDSIFSLPIIPTFKEINDCVHTVCQNRISHKLLIRQAIWNTYIDLSNINIYSIKLSEAEIINFENKTISIFEQIDSILKNYIDSQILYIKSNQNTWINELIVLHQRYNKIKSGHYTKDEMIDFSKHVTEYYTYILNIFENKYKSNF